MLSSVIEQSKNKCYEKKSDDITISKNGKLLGLEVLSASKYFSQEKLDEIGKESYKD